MDDDTASCFIAGRDQNVEPLLHTSTEPSPFLDPSSINIISSASNLPSLGGFSSYSQPSALQEDDILQVPTISYPSTAANSDSSGSNTVVKCIIVCVPISAYQNFITNNDWFVLHRLYSIIFGDGKLYELLSNFN